MHSLIRRHRDQIKGVLSGWDRLRFRGTLRAIAYPWGLHHFLLAAGIDLKDFMDFALTASRQLVQATNQLAEQAGRPLVYLPASSTRKEDEARAIARREGTCVKHHVNRNVVKMYDKQASVLRVETVVNNPEDFKVYRATENDPGGAKQWRRLRKGVVDLPRRADVSQAANQRYLEGLAAVDAKTPVGDLAAPVCRPVRWHGRRARALNPLAEGDVRLLAAVSRGEFALNGFRNRDLRSLLFGDAPAAPEQVRRQSAAVTRHLRLLRAHRLIRKVAHTHRYVLSDTGRTVLTALLAARKADAASLLGVA